MGQFLHTLEDGRKRAYDPRVHPFSKMMDCRGIRALRPSSRAMPGNDAELDLIEIDAQRVRTGGGASGEDSIPRAIGVAWAVSGGVPGITTTRVPTWTRP
jgi:hypothetical protein